MPRRDLLTIAFLAVSSFAIAPLVGCGGDDDTGGSDPFADTTTSGTGGAGDTGGGASGGAGGGGGGSGTGGGNEGVPADHLLISEVAVSSGASEFVEIWNPTNAEVDLTDYYLSDNSTYFGIADGQAWLPAGTAGLDFLVRFPAGQKLAPGGYLVLATDEGFEAEYMKCADLALTSTPVACGGGSLPTMLAPENGALGGSPGVLLTNDGEMLVLFTWDGTVGHPLKDVDYVIWGTNAGSSERADKTNLPGYSADTARDDQRPAASPSDDQSIARCAEALEPGETLQGGNGITGHNETSEWLDQSFQIAVTRTPGAQNACLPKE
jgi:hypothetical protein